MKSFCWELRPEPDGLTSNLLWRAIGRDYIMIFEGLEPDVLKSIENHVKCVRS